MSKALATVSVPFKGLSKLPPEVQLWQIQKRRVRKRDTLIYKEWLEADNKEAVIALLAEKWGFTRKGDILRIVEKMRTEGAVIPAMAAEISILRRVKTEEVLIDYEEYRAEIELQLRKLRMMRERGEKWVEIQEVDDSGGKNPGVKTTKTRIDVEIKRLEAEKAKSHADESSALSNYSTRKDEREGAFRDAGRATAEFLKAWSEISRHGRTDDVIDAEVEVVNE